LKLYEYEAKNILKTYGIPTPHGEAVASPSEARMVAANMKPPFAVKAQVLVAGRGKAGGILFADTVEEAEKAAEDLFRKQVKGIPVKKILVEEKIPIVKQLYFSITIDRFERRYVLIASTKGGIEIEEIAARTPLAILKTPINPQEGFRNSDAKQIAEKMGYSGNRLSVLTGILEQLYRAGTDYDAELIEINPLAETTDGRFVAADARLIIDDNALFRHPELEKRQFTEERENTPKEIEAAKNGLAYVKLDGDIGIVGNGAGLVMATLDIVQYYGGKPADFLDLGGGAPVERITAALEIVLSDPNVKAVLVNILGGITRCDDVARAIVKAKHSARASKPFVIRLVGTNEEEGKRILTQAGIAVLDSMEKAAQRAVQIAKEEL
jgi:succinyl-CoA synthetase beta subunit